MTIFDSSLAQCKYMSRRSSRPCPSWAKAWAIWLPKRIVDYCMDNSLLSSIHVKYRDWAINLFIDDSRETILLENDICNVSWPDICTTYSTDSFQASNLLVVPLKFSIEDNAVCTMVCSMITYNNRLALWIVPLACPNGITSRWFVILYYSCVSHHCSTHVEKCHKGSHLN